MPRRIRSHSLETRSQRHKLPVSKKPLFVRIAPGISLGYRKNQVVGKWVVRVANGLGGSWMTSIGIADDHDNADGKTIFDFWQAQEAAKEKANKDSNQTSNTPITVREAVENYLIVQKGENPRTAADTKGRLEKHFLPQFGSQPVSAITKSALEQWLASLIRQSEDPEVVRRSKDTANRVLTMVKAALNHALRDDNNEIKNDTAWRLVKPYKDAGKPRPTRYTPEEVRKLINNAPNIATANLITAAYLTGARYGELTECRIGDLDLSAGTLQIRVGKTGPRNIILQTDAVRYLSTLITGRDPNDYLLVKSDGSRWKRSEQTRPFAETLQRSGLPSNGTLYGLRHSHISVSIEGGVPLNLIGENCGTSVRMIEKTYAKILDEHRRNFIENGAPRL
jgi:integrase